MENRVNREIREIRELRKFLREQVWIFRVVCVFRGSKNSLGGDLGALFPLKSRLFCGKFRDAFGMRLEVKICA